MSRHLLYRFRTQAFVPARRPHRLIPLALSKAALHLVPLPAGLVRLALGPGALRLGLPDIQPALRGRGTSQKSIIQIILII